MGDTKPESSTAETSSEFTGNYPLRLDSALRVAIPAKFKEVLDKQYGLNASQVALVPDFGKVKVLPLSAWEGMKAKLKELSEFDPASEDYRTFIFGNTAQCTLDAQNRVKLTPSLCELAELDKEVVFVGREDRMEIWDAGKWKEFSANTAKNIKSVMAEVFRNRQASGGR